MEPWEKVQRKARHAHHRNLLCALQTQLDDRLDKPDKTPQSRSPGYSQKMTMYASLVPCAPSLSEIP